MNNNITEDYCSFEVSKLLKEKGFWQVTTNWFDKNKKEIYWSEIEGTFKESNLIPKSTHALAIKWIRENFGIHIHTERNFAQFKGCISATLPTELHNKLFRENSKIFIKDSPKEAVEAALLYTLTHLIK